MKIIPTAGPVIQADTGAPSPSQVSARDRAIAKLMGTPAELNAQPSQTPKTQYPASQRPTLAIGGHKVQDQQTEEAVQASEAPVTEDVTVQESTTEGSQAASETPDAAPEATQAAPKAPEEPQLSSQFAQLARKEKAFRAQQNAFKAEQAAMKAREDAIKAREVEMQTKYIPKDDFAKDPVKVLQDQGYTPEQITNMLLNQPDPAEQKLMSMLEQQNAKIKALEEAAEATKKSNEDNQRQTYTQAVNHVRTEVNALVDSDPAFETIKAAEASEDVVDLITKTFEKEGRLLSVDEAATAVEEYLIDEALKLARLKKIQDRLKPAPEAIKAAAAVTPPAQSKPTQAKTLTSTMTNTRPLTARERAIMAFNGERKS